MPDQSRNHQSLLQKVDCFLFDLDGTLIDSSPCHERAFFKTLEAHQQHLVNSFVYEEHKGKSTKETFQDLGIDDSRLLKLMTESKQNLYRQMVEDGEVIAFPFAEQVLSALRSRGHRVWVVTGATPTLSRVCAFKARTNRLFRSTYHRR